MTITLTPQAFDTLKNQLLSTHQAEITGDKDGTITGHGVNANFHYADTSQTLTVDIVHHPFFIPVSAIEKQLRQAAADAA